jgi:dimethylhistidine N-methyltransferase
MNAARSAMQRQVVEPTQDLLGDTLAGLARTPRRLLAKYFYDARGSQLFEQITQQPEYYLTRVEQALLDARLGEIAEVVGPGAHVVEFGSGSGRKTRQLLAALPAPVAYTPVEISRAALQASVARLREEFPRVEMLPVCADFTREVEVPRPACSARTRLLFFPGSTLGNFEQDEAIVLLRSMASAIGASGQALVGIDLDKDPALIEAAYNDAAGITAQFTLNLLARLNRELGSDFDLEGFQHRAIYARERGRIETALVSQRAQAVTLAGKRFAFAAGEAIDVEISSKYTDARFEALVAAAGLRVTGCWNDPRDWFGLRLLRRG